MTIGIDANYLQIATGLFEIVGGMQILCIYPDGAQRLWGWMGIIAGPLTIAYHIWLSNKNRMIK